MATNKNSKSSVWIDEMLIKIERDLESKERQLLQEYGKTNMDIDIKKELQTWKDLSSETKSKSISDMRIQLKLEEKRKRAKTNCCLVTKIEPMQIPSTISYDQSLIKLIETLDNASSKLPSLSYNQSLGRMHRANVSISSSNDAWIYSLDPSTKLILPRKRKDTQTTCRICDCKVQTNVDSPTDFLLCKDHQANLERFTKTIKSIYGSDFTARIPKDHTQFHLNLYGPVLNRLNLFIQQLKARAAKTEQSDIKNIYEIMIDTNIMFKAAIVIYERYLNPINMEVFFFNILTLLGFLTTHETQILDGLRAAERMKITIRESFLSITTRLLVLTRIVLQTFFGFFAIQVNMIYQSVIANIIWQRVSQMWLPITAAILIGTLTGTLAGPLTGLTTGSLTAIATGSLTGVLASALAVAVTGAIVVSAISVAYLTYRLRQRLTQPAAINADIDQDDLIIGN